MKSKPKIILFTRDYLGYSETFIIDQINALRVHFKVHILALNRAQGLSSDVENLHFLGEKNLFKGFNERMYNHGIYIPSASQVFETRALIEEIDPVAIIIHFGPNAFIFNALFSSTKIKKIVFFHGYDASKLLFSSFIYRKRFTKLQKKKNIEFYFVSKGLKKISESIMGKGVIGDVHYLGIDIKRFERTEYRVAEKSFLIVARFDDKKGHDVLLKAISRIENLKGYKFTFVGDGHLQDQMIELSKKLKIEKVVKFLGAISRDKVLALLNTHKYFILPSKLSKEMNAEGLPISIMEAMAMEMPIISTCHSGIPELVQNNINGILVNENDIEGLKCAILSIATWEFLPQNRTRVHELFNIEINTLALSKSIKNSRQN